MALDQVDVDKTKDEKEMSFLEHLEVLRWHLIRGIVSILIFGAIIFIFQNWIFDNIILAHSKKSFFTYEFFCNLSDSLCFFPKPFHFEAIDMEEQFVTSLKVAVLLGIVVAFPYIFWEMWRFVKPGLYPEERKAARGIVFICSSLFLMGILFGYYIVAPFAVTFLSNYSVGTEVVINTTPRLSSYVNLLAMITIPAGLIFELPIVVYFLSKVGLIGPEFMRTYRRHAFVVILIVAAIVTPPDVITQFLIGIPLYLLYEVSIFISAKVAKKREEEMK